MIKINFKMERRFFTAVMLILLLFTLCFITMPVSTAVDNDEDIVVDFHVIQLFQHDEAPGVISVSETITYNNTGDQNYTGTLNVWLHDFMDAYAYIDGMLLDLVALSSNLYSVQIPSNRSIEPHSSFLLNIEYLVNYAETDLDSLNLEKHIQYDTTQIMLIIFPAEGYEVEGTGIYIEKSTSGLFPGAYVTPHPPPATAKAGDELTFTFKLPETSEEKSGSNSNLIFMILTVIVALVLILYIFSRTKGTVKKNVDIDEKEIKEASGRNEVSEVRRSRTSGLSEVTAVDKIKDTRTLLIIKKKKILQTRKRLKTEYKNNKINKQTFEEKDKTYRSQLKSINKGIVKIDKQLDSSEIYSKETAAVRTSVEDDKELKLLLARKKTLLSVLKNLEKDFKESTIPEDVFEELRTEYKQEAIKILKKIDEIKNTR